MAVVSKLSIKMTGLLQNRAETYGTSSSSNISMNSFSGMLVICRIPCSNGIKFFASQLNQAHTETENFTAFGAGETLWETIPLLLTLNNNKMNLRFTIYKFKKSLQKTYEKFIISEKMTFSHELPTFSFANLFLLSNSQSNKEFAILFQTY